MGRGRVGCTYMLLWPREKETYSEKVSSVKIESLLDEKQYVNVLHFLVFVFAFFVLISFLNPGLCHKRTRVFNFIYFFRESKDGAVMRELASH